MDNTDCEKSDRPFLRKGKPIKSKHWMIMVLLLVSLVIRITYFTEIGKGPCYSQHLWDQSDMNFFHIWAQQLMNGDWINNKPLHPYHDSWHDKVAETYFRSHTDQEQELNHYQHSMHTDKNTKRQLWNRWYGGKRYHQEPLYAYLIAIIYKILSVKVAWVFIFQLSIGILNIFLIYVITMRFFGQSVAIIAATLAVFSEPLLFFEMLLLRSTLISFFGLLLVWLIVQVQNNESPLSWGILGLFLGIAILLKSTFLFFFVCLMGLLILRHRHSLKRTLTYVSALVAGVLLSLTPLISRNIYVGTSPLGLSGVTSVTLITANARDSYPHGFIVSNYIADIMGRTDGAVLPTVIETLKTHSFTSYATLLWHKFRLMWHWYEIPNNANIYYYRLHSLVLRSLPVSFLIIAPLCIVGLCIAIWERQRCFPLYLLLSMHVVSIFISYVAARFRAPLFAASLPFAALTVTRIIESLQTRFFRKTVLICLSLVLISIWTMRPLPQKVSLIRNVDCLVPFTFYYHPHLLAAKAKGDVATIIGTLEALLRHEPRSIRQLNFASPPRNQSDRDTAFLFAKFRRMYANVLLQIGKNEEARTIGKRAKELEILATTR